MSKYILSTILSFGGIQAAQIILPLLALPWLARVLGPDAFGLLMYMSLLTVIVGQIMDWGFALGGVRTTACCREDPVALHAVLSHILSAKVLLFVGCCVGAVLALPLLPHATQHPSLYALAVSAGLVRGFNPTWFFQGLGQGMRRMAYWDVGSSVVILLLTILLVRDSNDGYTYLLLLTLGKGIAYGWLYVGLSRTYAGITLNRAHGLQALARTRTLFFSVLFAIIYTNGAQLVLGFLLEPRSMGMLLAAEKIVRAVVSLTYPIMQTLFPEICAQRIAIRWLRWSLFATGLAMCCAAVLVWIFAPSLITLTLGQDYVPAITALRLLTPLIPLLACNMILGTQILVAFEQEKALARVQAIVALVSLGAAVLLAQYAGLAGAALLSPLVESLIMLGLVGSIVRYCPQALAFAPKKE